MLTELQALSALHNAKEELFKAMQKYNLALQDFIPHNEQAKDKYQLVYYDIILK